MKTIQKTFNNVIDNGFYPKDPYMCYALRDAKEAGHISSWQYWITSTAIKLYLRKTGYGSLKWALYKSNHPHTEPYRVAIYRDWANRPTLLAKKHQKPNS